MHISKKKQVEELLLSFEVLKNDFSEYSYKLSILVGTMFKLDIDKALKLWEQLIFENQDILKTKHSYNGENRYTTTDVFNLTNGVLDRIDYEYESRAYYAIFDNSFLKQSLFGVSGCVHRHTIDFIGHFVEQNDFDKANEILEMIEHNPNHGTPLYTVLNGIVGMRVENNDTYEFLKKWIDKVPEEKERAALNISLIYGIDEGDDYNEEDEE